MPLILIVRYANLKKKNCRILCESYFLMEAMILMNFSMQYSVKLLKVMRLWANWRKYPLVVRESLWWYVSYMISVYHAWCHVKEWSSMMMLLPYICWKICFYFEFCHSCCICSHMRHFKIVQIDYMLSFAS